MLFSSRVPVKSLLVWCRALRQGLHAGLSPVRVFRMQAKSGPPGVRPLAKELADRMERGDTMSDAVTADRGKFPMLFVELLAVGETAGRLTETFEVLEAHYKTVLAARKQFARALIWPGFMAVSAVGVVALLITIMGLIPGGFDPLGLGLVGPGGAVTFLFFVGSAAFAVGFLAWRLRDDDATKSKLEGLALPVPGLGACFRAFALERFSVAMHMTSEAGLGADRALKLSLRATANSAYMYHADRAGKLAHGGQEVADVLETCGPQLFPPEFVETVRSGEETGQLAEVMATVSEHCREEAAAKLKTLTMIAGGVVYAGVACLVIFVIFRLAMSIGGIYQDAMKGI
ncbi:MAG: type II secretion system F family protein [Fimbriiglobus sp.]